MVSIEDMGIVGKFVGLMVIVLIAFNVAWPVVDASLFGGSSHASNILSYSGNVSDGELVNISSYTFEYDFNGAYTVGHIPVVMDAGNGNATYAILNLVSAINSNASVSGLVSVVGS